MRKIYMMMGMFAISVLTVSGCSVQDEVSIEKLDKQDIPINVEERTMKEKRAEEKNEYTVDESDHVKVATLIAKISESDINVAEKDDLILMREEEKLARDVYRVLGDKWGQKIFENIAQSEQTHTDAIKALLDHYEIIDPVTDDTVGVFASPILQKLYDDLVVQGSASLVAALTVGATIEDLDIKDLHEAIARTDNDDIREVYDNLTRGSRNHMRAFYRQLKRNHAIYEAQFLSQAEIDAILADDQERGLGDGGGKNGSGQGKGHGRGNGGGKNR